MEAALKAASMRVIILCILGIAYENNSQSSDFFPGSFFDIDRLHEPGTDHCTRG